MSWSARRCVWWRSTSRWRSPRSATCPRVAAWGQQPRSLGCGISNSRVDDWYEAARRAGAKGGKLLGAGGDGFLLLIAPPSRHRGIREALGRPRELAFRIARRGSWNIFIQN